MKENNYREPYLHDCNGDISKRWCIRFSVQDPDTLKMIPFKKYKGLNQDTADERYKAATLLIKKWKQLLESGWMPNDDVVKYKYTLGYRQEASKTRVDMLKTFAFFASKFIETLTEPKYRRKTMHGYKSKCRQFNYWLESNNLDKVYIGEISNKHILDFFYFLRNDQHREDITISKYMQVLNEVFKFAGIQSPVHSLPKLKKSNQKYAAKPIPEVLIKEFATEIKKDHQLYLAVSMMYYAFIRPEELRGLKIRDIDFRRWTVTIPANIAKNGKSQTIGVPDPLIEIIKINMLHMYDGDCYVFSHGEKPGYTQLGHNNLANRFRKIRDKLGVSKVYKFYSYKHTGAIMLSELGIPVKDIQQHLRHSSLETTDNYLVSLNGKISNDIRHKFPELY